MCERIFSETVKRINTKFHRKVAFHHVFGFFFCFFFSNLKFFIFSCVCIYTELSPYVRPSRLHPCFNSHFSHTAVRIHAKIYERYLSAISPDRFIFLLQNFHFCFVLLKWDPVGTKISKRYFSRGYNPISSKLYDRFVRHVGI